MADHEVVKLRANNQEAVAFDRYLVLFEEACRLADDMKVLDNEMKKDRLPNQAAIKKLARLTARDAVQNEIKKFNDLRSAAHSSAQKCLDLFLDQ